MASGRSVHNRSKGHPYLRRLRPSLHTGYRQEAAQARLQELLQEVRRDSQKKRLGAKEQTEARYCLICSDVIPVVPVLRSHLRKDHSGVPI